MPSIGNLFRLRVDSLKAMSSVRFEVPASTLRRAKDLTLRVRTSAALAERFRLVRRGGNLVGDTGDLQVAFGPSSVTISNLPSNSGIVRMNIHTRARLVGMRKRGRRMTAKVKGQGGAMKLNAQLAPRRS